MMIRDESTLMMERESRESRFEREEQRRERFREAPPAQAPPEDEQEDACSS